MNKMTVYEIKNYSTAKIRTLKYIIIIFHVFFTLAIDFFIDPIFKLNVFLIQV